MESRKKDEIPAASAAPSQISSTGACSQDPSIRAPPQDPSAVETLAYDADAEAASFGTPHFFERDPGLLLTEESAWKVDHLLRKDAAEMDDDDAALAKQLQNHVPSCEAPSTEEKLQLASPTIEKSEPLASQVDMDECISGPQDSKPADDVPPPTFPSSCVSTMPTGVTEPAQAVEPAHAVELAEKAEVTEAALTEADSTESEPVKVTEAEPVDVDALMPEPADAPTPCEHGAPTDMVAKQDLVSMLECMLSDGMDLKDAIEQVKGAPLVLRVEQFKNKSKNGENDPDEAQLPGQSGQPRAKAKATAKAKAKAKARAKAKTKAKAQSKSKAAAKRKAKAGKATEKECGAGEEVLEIGDDQPTEESEPKEAEPEAAEPEAVPDLDEVQKVKRRGRKAKKGQDCEEDQCKEDEPKLKKQRGEANSFARRPCPATSPAKDRWAAIVKAFKEEIRKPLMDMKEPMSKWEERGGIRMRVAAFLKLEKNISLEKK